MHLHKIWGQKETLHCSHPPTTVSSAPAISKYSLYQLTLPIAIHVPLLAVASRSPKAPDVTFNFTVVQYTLRGDLITARIPLLLQLCIRFDR